MEVHWVIEAGVFVESAPRMQAALDSRGLRWTRYEDGAAESSLPPPGSCVVFWGSLGAAYQNGVAARWTPGAIGDAERFRCSAYVPRLQSVLANGDAVMTTVRDLVERTAAVLRSLGNPERIFVRPDSALKPFAGRVVATHALSLTALDHGFYYDDEDLPIAVARARRIGREWRCVISDGAVVAACEYARDRRGSGTDAPGEIHELASLVARGSWQPAPIYVVDLAEVDGAPSVMELNPFSGADLYLCDAAAVVDAATRVARRLYAGAAE